MRTDSQKVGGIIEVDPEISLDPFIETASALVNEVEENSDHDANRLELIERWLSAHFYAMRDPRPTQEKAGPVAQTLQSKVDLNLANSHYGQQAIVLDTSGTLATLNQMALKGKSKVAVGWLGTPLPKRRFRGV